MEYKLFIIVEDMDVARGAVELLEAGGVHAYIDDKTDYTRQPLKIEWGVMVDKVMSHQATNLLASYMKEKDIDAVSALEVDASEEAEPVSVNTPLSSPRSMPSSVHDSSSSFSVWKFMLGVFAVVYLCARIGTFCSRHDYKTINISPVRHNYVMPYYDSVYTHKLYKRIGHHLHKNDSTGKANSAATSSKK